MPTACAYLRISLDQLDPSADPQEDRPQRLRRGVTRQRQDVAALAERLGVELAEVFEDNSVSATKVRRADTEWARCLAWIEEHRPDYLLAFKLDRLARTLTDFETLERLGKSTGLRVITVAEGDLFQSAIWPFAAAQAKTEAMNTSLRVRRALQARRERGLDNGGGSRAFGFEDDKVTVIPDEAMVIREMADRVIAGESLNSLCRELAARGIRKPQGGTFLGQPHQLGTLLTRPRYAGLLEHKGEVIGKAAWPAILDESTYAAVRQVILEKKAKYPQGGRPISTLLGGIVRCGLCRTPMRGGATGNGGLTYRCPTEGCGKVVRQRAKIEEFVVERLLADVDTGIIDAERSTLREEVEGLRIEIGEAEHRLYVLHVKHDRREVGESDFYRTLDTLRRQATALQRAYEPALARLRAMQGTEAAADRWESWSVDQRRAFIRSRLAAILVYPATSRGRGAVTIRTGEVELVPATAAP